MYLSRGPHGRVSGAAEGDATTRGFGAEQDAQQAPQVVAPAELLAKVRVLRRVAARAAEVDRLARRAHLARRQPPPPREAEVDDVAARLRLAEADAEVRRLDVAVDVPRVVHVLDRVDHLQREQRHRRRREALVRRRAAHLRDVLAEQRHHDVVAAGVAAHLDEARDGVGVGELAQHLVLVDEHGALLRLARQFYGHPLARRRLVVLVHRLVDLGEGAAAERLGDAEVAEDRALGELHRGVAHGQGICARAEGAPRSALALGRGKSRHVRHRDSSATSQRRASEALSKQVAKGRLTSAPRTRSFLLRRGILSSSLARRAHCRNGTSCRARGLFRAPRAFAPRVRL